MSQSIKDGTGDCYSAKVDKDHRLYTKSTGILDQKSAAFNSRAFVIASGDITLTNDSESAILYICNNEDSDLIVDEIIIGVGASTGGSGLAQSVTYINPTGGTIITDQNDVTVANLDSGSSVTLAGDFYVGGQGKTFVGTGFPSSLFVVAPAYDRTLSLNIIKKGQCAGLSLIPPSGNTSMLVTVTLGVYLKDYI